MGIMKAKAKKNLFNRGRCFTKGKMYDVRDVKSVAELMEVMTTNDLGELHIIGSWWRNFTLVNNQEQ